MNTKARRVLVESPFRGDPGVAAQADHERNVQYARAAMRDCFARGEIPYCSHLLYTQPGILDDRDPMERAMGILAGLSWGACAEITAVYEDLGVSEGMRQGIAEAYRCGRPVDYRRVPGWEDKA